MHLIRSEEIRARDFMLIIFEGTLKRSIVFVEPYHQEMSLVLRPAADHTTIEGHIGPW